MSVSTRDGGALYQDGKCLGRRRFGCGVLVDKEFCVGHVKSRGAS